MQSNEKFPPLGGMDSEMNIFLSQDTDKIFSALAHAQGEFSSAEEGNVNSFFNSKYATIKSLRRASQKSLAKNGLFVSHIPKIVDGKQFLFTLLGHSSGQWIRGEMEVPSPKTDTTIDKYGKEKRVNLLQVCGIALSYLSRYMYRGMTGVVSGVDETDDDGEGYPMEEKPHCSQAQWEEICNEVKDCDEDTIAGLRDLFKSINAKSADTLPLTEYHKAKKWIASKSKKKKTA